MAPVNVHSMKMQILIMSSFFQFRSFLGEYKSDAFFHSGIFSPHKHVVTCHQGTSMGEQASRRPPRSHCCHPCAAGANTTPPDAEANRQAGDRWLGSPEHIHECVRVRSSTNSHMLQEETMHVSIPIGRRPSCDCSESAAV